MEATHVLFARDLKSNFSIEDPSAFYAGSIYPDSRYVTRTPRQTTHGEGSPQDPFAPGISDFERGWATHLRYDQLAGGRMRELLKGDPDTSREAWVTMTAMKLLEDQQSYDRLGGEAAEIFRTMRVDMHVRGEDPDVMRAYFAMNAELYAKRPEFDDYKRFFEKFTPSSEYTEGIVREAQRLSNQGEVREAILAIYDQTLEKDRLLRSEKEGRLSKR